MEDIFVVGSGIMGKGIAQACAQAGYRVCLMDIDDQMLQKAIKSMEWSLNKMEEKEILKEKAHKILSRIIPVTSLEKAKDASFVIEAIFEDLNAKHVLFKKLEKICSPDTIFGTNTSSIPIIEIAAAIKIPQRFVGIHFFNPVHKMKLVEIIKSLATSDDTVEKTRKFAVSIGKDPVVVNRDTAGFLVNRINGMAFLEALKLLEKGVASVEDIDKAMRLGLGNAMGPFELMDLVGLDIVFNARMGIYNETREPNHFPPAILNSMVKAGWLGRKTGKGFYEYK
ncbi:MAG: 3-hydroxyacyl-CoA dehydrogenase family protein [Desulfobacteraceae bacterium]|nr:3-hydroxyacyl-CoA dehydrogenase family protein [Desulfobacteraceae bacterium]